VYGEGKRGRREKEKLEDAYGYWLKDESWVGHKTVQKKAGRTIQLHITYTSSNMFAYSRKGDVWRREWKGRGGRCILALG
jgi:hypothetical protein